MVAAAQIVPADRQPKRLIFADFLIWCYAWAIDCGEGPAYGRITLDDGDGYVADSFAEFVNLYLAGDPSAHTNGRG